MNLVKIAPFLLLPALACAAGGCASSEDDAASDEGALTAGAEFTSAVGAVVINGKKVCTAALVDVDASAKIGSVSAHGRQIVFGGACVGQLKNGFTGAAVFVTQQNGLSVSSPILSFDFESQASAGLAVGILSSPVPGAEPLDVVGVTALANAGAHVATVLHADENGVLIGAAAEIHAGVAFRLKTECTSFRFSAQAGIAVGAAVSVNDDGLGAAAFVRLNGRLHFAANIDGRCVVQHFGDSVGRLASGALVAANDFGDSLSSLGQGKLVAVARTKTQLTTVAVRLTEDVKAVRVNGQGHISATARGATCDKIPLILIGGPCELRPAGGYKKGELVTLTIDTHGNLFPDGPRGTRLAISTTNEAPPAPSNFDPFNNGGG